MKIQVRKCGFTGELFEHDTDYVIHLRKLRSRQQHRRQHVKSMQEFDAWLDQARFHIHTPRELEDWLNNNWPRILQHSQHMCWVGRQHADLNLRFKFVDVRACSLVSNSHSCPRDGVTNWHGDPQLPRGYPGWQGRIRIYDVGNLYEGFYSNLLRSVPIHTGSGSGSHGMGEYELRLYASDWPGMWVHENLIMT